MFNPKKILVSSVAVSILALSACNPLEGLLGGLSAPILDVVKTACNAATGLLPIKELGNLKAEDICTCVDEKSRAKAKEDKGFVGKLADETERGKIIDDLIKQCTTDLGKKLTSK